MRRSVNTENKMADIDRLDRGSAIDLAKRMRSKNRNLALDRDRLTRRVGAVVAAAGAAYVMGYYMGGLQHEYQQNQTAIDAGTMEDPRKMAGIDIDLLAGLGLAVVGLGMQGAFGARKRVGIAADLVEGAGTGILSGYANNLGMSAGLEAAEEA